MGHRWLAASKSGGVVPSNMAIRGIQILSVARWTTRIIGTLLLLLIAIFAIGEGVPNPIILSPRELLLFAALTTMIIGLVLAFRWEGIGGLLILGGFAFFSIVNQRISLNIVFLPWLLTGLIYLGCWWIKGKVAGSFSTPS